MEEIIIKEFGTITNFVKYNNDLTLIEDELKDYGINIDIQLIKEKYVLLNRDIVEVILFFTNFQ